MLSYTMYENKKNGSEATPPRLTRPLCHCDNANIAIYDERQKTSETIKNPPEQFFNFQFSIQIALYLSTAQQHLLAISQSRCKEVILAALL